MSAEEASVRNRKRVDEVKVKDEALTGNATDTAKENTSVLSKLMAAAFKGILLYFAVQIVFNCIHH